MYYCTGWKINYYYYYYYYYVKFQLARLWYLDTSVLVSDSGWFSVSLDKHLQATISHVKFQLARLWYLELHLYLSLIQDGSLCPWTSICWPPSAM